MQAFKCDGLKGNQTSLQQHQIFQLFTCSSTFSDFLIHSFINIIVIWLTAYGCLALGPDYTETDTYRIGYMDLVNLSYNVIINYEILFSYIFLHRFQIHNVLAIWTLEYFCNKKKFNLHVSDVVSVASDN